MSEAFFLDGFSPWPVGETERGVVKGSVADEDSLDVEVTASAAAGEVVVIVRRRRGDGRDSRRRHRRQIIVRWGEIGDRVEDAKA